MAYDKQTWADAPATTSPLSAERLGHMEDGIDDAHAFMDSATGTGNALLTATDTAAARVALDAARESWIDARKFGVVVDDEDVDNTEALQDFFEYVVTNRKQGWLPNSDLKYMVTDTLIVPSGHGWRIHGENENYAIISQATDNIPVLQFGEDGEASRTWAIDGIWLTYESPQPSTNTGANCIVFEGLSGQTTSAYAGLYNLRFSNGYYCMAVASGKVAPWGSEFDMLHMLGMSGGFYDNTGSIGGCPNNKWGRLTLYCDDAVGPIFKAWNTYNSTVGAIEFLRAENNQQLINAFAGFGADIGSVKLEGAVYTEAQTLISLPGSHHARIGSVVVEGDSAEFAPASGTLAVVGIDSVGAPSTSLLEIGTMNLSASALSGNCVGFKSSSSDASKVRVGNVRLADGWTLHDRSASPVGDFLTVGAWVNNALSGNKGDANYTVTLGDPNIVHFNTAFTAQRTITLPSQTSNDTCAGLYYDLVFDGAINGANTALIKQGSTTIRTQSVDGRRLRFAWRRSVWVLVGVSSIADDLATQAAVDGKQPKFLTGTVATAAATATKAVTLDSPWASYTPVAGDYLLLKFTSGITVASATVAINGGSAIALRTEQGGVSNNDLGVEANGALLLRYDGTYLRAPITANNRYTEITDTEIVTPAHSTGTTISGRRAAYLKRKAIATAVTSSATPAISLDLGDWSTIAVGHNITAVTTTGTGHDLQTVNLKLVGTGAFTLAFGATWNFGLGVSAPASIANGKAIYIFGRWNAATSTVHVVDVKTEA